MRKRGIFILSLVFVLLAILAGAFFAAQSYLNSETSQKKIIAELSAKLQAEVKTGKMRIRLLRGVDMVDIRLLRDDVRPREYLKAERLRVRYDLFEALAHQRFVLEEVKLSLPSITLDLSEPVAASKHNTQALAVSPKGPTASKETARTSELPPPDQAIVSVPVRKEAIPVPAPHQLRWPSPPDVDLRSFAIENGSLDLLLPDREHLMLQGANIKGSFSRDPVPTGAGQIICETMTLPHAVRLNETTVSFLWREESIDIPKLSTQIFGGFLEGSLRIDQTQAEMPFESLLFTHDLDLNQLLTTTQETGLNLVAHFLSKLLGSRSGGTFRGNIQNEVRLQGSMLDFTTTHGQGQLRILKGSLSDYEALVKLNRLLRRKDVRETQLQKCEIDFLVGKQKLEFPRMEISSKDIQVTGSGWIHTVDQKQAFDMTMAFSRELTAQIHAEELAGVVLHEDGSTEIAFHLWGSLNHPENDLEAKLKPLAARVLGAAMFDQIFDSIPTK